MHAADSFARAQTTGKINTNKKFLSMIFFTFLKKSILPILFQTLFMVTIFFSTGCRSKKHPLISACLTAEEKADLECFFRFLIFENYGAFVLFGSKPLCQTHLSDEESTEIKPAFQKWVSSLPDDRRAAIEVAINKAHAAPEPEHNLYRGWGALEKVRRNFKMGNFIFRLTPVYFLDSDELIPDTYDLTLINIQQTALVLAENYEIFKAAAGMDFDPLQAVFEAQNSDSIFWKNVFSMQNHVAKGLLFGFGIKNSIFFNWCELVDHPISSNAQQAFALDDYREDILKYTPIGHKLGIWAAQKPRDSIDRKRINIDNMNPFATPEPRGASAAQIPSLWPIGLYLQNHSFELSTAPVEFGKGSSSNFTIPMFRTIIEDDTVEKYTKEKTAIEKTYDGHDVVEVTLRRLVGLY